MDKKIKNIGFLSLLIALGAFAKIFLNPNKEMPVAFLYLPLGFLALTFLFFIIANHLKLKRLKIDLPGSSIDCVSCQETQSMTTAYAPAFSLIFRIPGALLCIVSILGIVFGLSAYIASPPTAEKKFVLMYLIYFIGFMYVLFPVAPIVWAFFMWLFAKQLSLFITIFCCVNFLFGALLLVRKLVYRCNNCKEIAEIP